MKVIRKEDGTELCERCQKVNYTTVVEGEKDSMGVEEVFLCDTCVIMETTGQDEYFDALDVEDRAGFFIVSGVANNDTRDYFAATKSYRQAVARLRAFENDAEGRGGLYPFDQNRLREVATEEEWRGEIKDEAESAAREMAAWAEEEEWYWYEEEEEQEEFYDED